MNDWELYTYLMSDLEKITPRQAHGNNYRPKVSDLIQVRLRLLSMQAGDYPSTIKKDLQELLLDLQSEQDLR